MPHQPSNLQDAPGEESTPKPKQGIGLLTAQGVVSVIPPGAGFMFFDPALPDGMVLMGLKEASRKVFKFKCPCGDKACTREAVAHVKWLGNHPRQFKDGK